MRIEDQLKMKIYWRFLIFQKNLERSLSSTLKEERWMVRRKIFKEYLSLKTMVKNLVISIDIFRRFSKDHSRILDAILGNWRLSIFKQQGWISTTSAIVCDVPKFWLIVVYYSKTGEVLVLLQIWTYGKIITGCASDEHTERWIIHKYLH